jgi:hypothetical protein
LHTESQPPPTGTLRSGPPAPCLGRNPRPKPPAAGTVSRCEILFSSMGFGDFRSPGAFCDLKRLHYQNSACADCNQIGVQPPARQDRSATELGSSPRRDKTKLQPHSGPAPDATRQKCSDIRARPPTRQEINCNGVRWVRDGASMQ